MFKAPTFIFAFVLLLTVCPCQKVIGVDTPVWPSTFNSQIYQFTDSNHTTGTYWYDFANSRQRTDRSNTYTDEICNSLLPNKTSLCTNVYANNKRFIMFPNEKICCQCCISSQGGCAMLQPNWLENATYKGTVFKSWDAYAHWLLVYGEIQIDYYQGQSVDANQIYRTVNGKRTWFYFDTVNISTIQDSIFSLPSYCKQNVTCPKSSSCSKFVLSQQIISQ